MRRLKIILTVILVIVGTLSVFQTLSIIFDWGDAREKHGNYVLYIVYTNLVCALLYLFSAIFIWRNFRWTKIAIGAACFLMLLGFVELQIYISKGGLHETRTVYAMIFRTILTFGFYLGLIYISRRSIPK